MQRFITSILIAAFGWMLVLPALAQVAPNAADFHVFDSQGAPATLSQLVERSQEADVVFWGEEHNDAIGHALQTDFFGQLIAKYGSSR